jgi:hypothetical protein
MVCCMKTTVQIPDSLFEEARKVAHKEKTTIKALVEQGLRKVLSERKKSKSFRLRKATYGGSGLQSHLTGASWDEIIEKSYEGRGG